MKQTYWQIFDNLQIFSLLSGNLLYDSLYSILYTNTIQYTLYIVLYYVQLRVRSVNIRYS